jgi:hypothetical protein
MGVIVAKLYDLASNELADVTPISLEKTMSRRLSGIRTFTIQAPAGHTLLTSTAGDGYPNLRRGNRKLLVWEDGTIIFHGRVWTVERNGNGTENLVTITAQMPLAELGYEGNGTAGRPVRGSTIQPTAGDPFGEYDGNLVTPLFASSVAAQDGISGPDIILQILTNTQNTGIETDPTPGEGPLPIDLTTGTFDLDVPDAVDLNPAGRMSWPILCGDMIQQIASTGVCDVDERPVDPTEGFDPFIMSALTAVSAFGTDRSDTVHFDYFTGSRNANQCRHVDDFSTINNKLYSYLGPPGPGGTRFPLGNITPGSPGTTVDPSASRALYGQFMEADITDWTGSPIDARPLAVALWNAEQGYRVEPRAMLYLTPNPDVKALWQAPADYDVGDLISVSVGADFGLTIAAVQRLYGYDKTWDRQGVATISGLITSAAEE